MRDSRLRSTPYYEFTNVNPRNRIGGDCVIRAIALATGQSWETTVREMTEMGIKKGLVLNDRDLYPLYLKEKGFVECKEPRDVNNRKMTVEDYLHYTCYGIDPDEINFVANVGSHHVAAVKNGKVRDIWNSSKETMHKYWVRNKE